MGFYKNILEDLKYMQLEKVKSFINEHLVFFFKKGDELFGCPEESRLVFAKMKNQIRFHFDQPRDVAGVTFNVSRTADMVGFRAGGIIIKRIDLIGRVFDQLLNEIGPDKPRPAGH